MGWRWDGAQADGSPALLGPSHEFPSQADAEAWLAQNYEELEDAGVDEVTLLQDDRVVYGPMSLHA